MKIKIELNLNTKAILLHLNLFIIFFVLKVPIGFSQIKVVTNGNVGIGTETPLEFAQLQIYSTSKGFLKPRMTNAQMLAIAPGGEYNGLEVFNTTYNRTYFWNGSEWVTIASDAVDNNAWHLGGNNITNNDFLGSVNPMPLRVFTNNFERMRIDEFGNVGIGTDSPQDVLHIKGRIQQQFPQNLNNIVIGLQAGNESMSGIYNNFLGEKSGHSNTTGQNNNFLGYESGFKNEDGTVNNFFGYKTGHENINGTSNNFLGQESGYSNTEGSQNNFLGYHAGYSNETGSNNNFFGYEAGANSISGHLNNFIGHKAGYSNYLGAYNNFIGTEAGYSNTEGINNNFIGNNAGHSNTKGAHNNFLGYRTGFNNSTGNSNNFIGDYAGYSNTEGINNNFIGSLSGYHNTSGYDNVFIGSQSGYMNTEGVNNCFMGNLSGKNNSVGDKNVFIGYEAGYFNESGNSNCFIGVFAGINNLNGADNVAIGNNANYSGNNFTNSTVIGFDATATQSNEVRLGNSNIELIEGNVPFTSPSDARFKFEIKSQVPGLEFITRLKPVLYKFDAKKYDLHVMQNMPDSLIQERVSKTDYEKSMNTIRTGFLAQDVERVCEKLNYQFDGLHVPDPKNKTDYYSLAYSSFVVPLVKAVQEQQEMIDKLEKLNKDQSKVIKELISRIENLEKK